MTGTPGAAGGGERCGPEREGEEWQRDTEATTRRLLLVLQGHMGPRVVKGTINYRPSVHVLSTDRLFTKWLYDRA
jgi:hypothetical protein